MTCATSTTGSEGGTHLRSFLDHALAYVSHGHRAVPLHEILADGSCSCGNANGTCPKPNGKDSSGKHPRFGGWQEDLIVDEAAAVRCWGRIPTANVGLCPKEREFVLDVDPRNGGDETFARLVYELEEPHGPCALTGGGGQHYWMLLPDRVDPSEAYRKIGAALKKLGPGIDLRTHKNQVVVEPSIHKSGRQYRWVEGRSILECEPVVPSAGWLAALGLFETPNTAAPPPQPQGAHQGADDDLARAEWGLLHQRLLDPDKGYDDWFRLGPALKCLGDAGLRLWIEASRPSKDFDEAEIHRKWPGINGSSIASLFGMFDDADPTWRGRYADQQALRQPAPTGTPFDAGHTGAVASEPAAAPSSPITRLWKPLRSLSIPPTPRRWLLRHPTHNGKPAPPGCGDGLLLRGKAGQLVSAGGVGKTMLMLQLGVSLILHRPWFGYFLPDDCAGRVLVGLAEEDDDEVHRRMHAVAEGLGLSAAERSEVERRCTVLALAGEDADLLTENKGKFAETQTMLDLRQRLVEDAGPDGWSLLLLDPLSRWGGLNTDMNTRAGTRVVQACESLCKVPGNPAVLAAQHSSKQSRREGKVENRGASSLTDGFRWEGTLCAKGSNVFFHQSKSNYSRPMDEPGIPITRGEHGVLSFDTASQPTPSDESEKNRVQLDADVACVVAALNAHGHRVESMDDIVALAGMGSKRGRPAVRLAVSTGLIVRGGKRPDRWLNVPERVCATPPIPPQSPVAVDPGREDPGSGPGDQRPSRRKVAEESPVADPDDGLPEQPQGQRRSRRKARNTSKVVQQ